MKRKEMKNMFFFIATLVVGSLFYSCNSDDLVEHQNSFEASQKKWLDFKKSSNNSYKYTTTDSSFLSGISWETTITVKNGVVIKRDFEYTSTKELLSSIEKNDLKWSEINSEIGSHKNGSEPITIDEIYNRAKKDWLIKRDDATTYFETENNGIISTCGYSETQCLDDCFIGIRIKNIRPF